MKNSKFTKLKKGDEVKIVIGKDKGKTGKVEQVLPVGQKVLITGINQYKRHVKARSQTQKSEIVTITKPLSVANVMVVCPKCHLTTRLGYLVTEDKKERVCKKCKQAI